VKLRSYVGNFGFRIKICISTRDYIAMLIDGKKIASEIISELERKPTPKKVLVAIRAGEDDATISFLERKKHIANHLKVPFQEIAFPNDVTQKEIQVALQKVNNDDTIGGIIIQLPLPVSLYRDVIVQTIAPEKDVDALSGNAIVEAPTVKALQAILEDISFKITGKTAAVVGKGFLVGNPIAKWLKKYTAYGVHIDFGDDFSQLKNAELIITGIGKPHCITGDYIKENAVVIDFGYTFKNGILYGDVHMESVSQKARFVTPTPGGTGPVVVAALFHNFYTLNNH
jgi:methylenetetrahydrofolate dehydrogenase (NADP+) / methenyltetrahydrofolate cyclohydrolase